MKAVMLVLITGALGAAGFWYITENARMDRAIEYRRRMEQQAKIEAEEKERIARQKAEDERIRKERAAAAAKEDAVRLFLNYIDREESRLKEEIEEEKINLEKIGIDQSALDAELAAIERANEMRVSSGEKRGETQQRDKVERVRALLKSAVLNRLARTYCGNDLSALRSEFEGEMQKIKDVDDRYKKRIGENLKKYDETVKGVDAAVERKSRAARAKFETIQNRIDDPKELARIKEQLKIVEKLIDEINDRYKGSARSSMNKYDMDKLERLRAQQTTLQTQLSHYEEISGLAAANLAHVEATEAETEARRKYDRAGKSLTMGNDMALLERDYEQDVYNRVREFEKRALDRLRYTMNVRRLSHEHLLGQAQKHLGYLKTKAVNIDFLTAEELADMRRDIAKRISKSIIEVEAGK